MNCRRTNTLLSAYLDGELTGAEMQSVRKHLDECEVCLHEHQSLVETKRLVSSLMYKAPRADLEALLLTDQRRMHRGPLGGIFDGFVDWSNTELSSGSVLRPRPLAATILLSVAGLYLASTALNPPGEHFAEVDHFNVVYPAFISAGPTYLAPVAFPTAVSEPRILSEPSHWVEIGPTRTSFVTVSSPGLRSPLNGSMIVLTSSTGTYTAAPVNVAPPQIELPLWANSGVGSIGGGQGGAKSLISFHH